MDLTTCKNVSHIPKEQCLLYEYRRRLAEVLEPFLSNATILDIGCGEGRLWTYDYFSKIGKYVAGGDVLRSEKWNSWKRKNLDFIVCDAAHLPFKDETFDVVFEKDSLHHMKNHARVLTEMRRVSRAKVVVVECNRYNPVSYLRMVRMRGHNHLS